MKIEINRKQKRIPTSLPRLRKLMNRLMAQAVRLNPRRQWQNISVVLLDDEGMAEINRIYLDHADVTDVISFAYPVHLAGERAENKNKACCWQGEIFVNVQRAVEEGGARGNIDAELALYLAHGADHLAGSTDYTLATRRNMRRRELRWLDMARADGLLAGLVRVRDKIN